MLTWQQDEQTRSTLLAAWSVLRTADQVPQARREVRRLAEAIIGPGDRAYELAICASEIIGNAIRHGGGPRIGILMLADDTRLTVEISDDGRAVPAPDPTGLDEGGLGLVVVAELADHWGSRTDPATGQLCVHFGFNIKDQGGENDPAADSA